MDRTQNASSKNLTVIIGIVAVVVVITFGGFSFFKNKSSQTPQNQPAKTAEKGVTGVTSQGTPEPTLEPVAPELIAYKDSEKYNFSLSYPASYGYATIDPSSLPFDPNPLLTLSFSQKWAGGGEETSYTSEDFPKMDPTLFVFDAKGKTLEDWVIDFKKRPEGDTGPKVVSERSIAVDNQPGYEVVTTVDEKKNTKKTFIVFYNGKAYEFTYYLYQKPGHASAILNSIKYFPTPAKEE